MRNRFLYRNKHTKDVLLLLDFEFVGIGNNMVFTLEGGQRWESDLFYANLERVEEAVPGKMYRNTLNGNEWKLEKVEYVQVDDNLVDFYFFENGEPWPRQLFYNTWVMIKEE